MKAHFLISLCLLVVYFSCQTVNDPEEPIVYDNKFVPPEGKVLFVMGQDIKSIDEYYKEFGQHHRPAGLSSYCAVSRFKGITFKDESGGHQYFRELNERYPKTVQHIAIWMHNSAWGVHDSVVNGIYDEIIDSIAFIIKAMDVPVYLRIGYEFDNPGNNNDPEKFVAAYKYVVDRLRAKGTTNIAYVWHSFAAGGPFAKYYPGDDYVDWVGISLFGHMYAPTLPNFAEVVIHFAKEHKKPVFIAESSPVYGITDTSNGLWDQWFKNYFTLMEDEAVKAFAFISMDWADTITYPDLVFNVVSLGWRNAKLQYNDNIKAKWIEEIAKEKYLKETDDLFELLGYMK